MPSFSEILAIVTIIFAIATWIVPPVRYALSFRKKPRDSLSVVGRVIGLVVLAAILSVVSLALAVLTLIYSERTGWGWFGVCAVGVYWFGVVIVLLISDHLARRRRQNRDQS